MSKVKAVFRGVTPEQKEKFKDSTWNVHHTSQYFHLI
jgi:hypothetical protein